MFYDDNCIETERVMLDANGGTKNAECGKGPVVLVDLFKVGLCDWFWGVGFEMGGASGGEFNLLSVPWNRLRDSGNEGWSV